MSQFVFQDMINKQGLTDQFYIDSAATSREEIGNGPHYGTVNKMREVGIPVLPHRAVQMTKKDYEKYDYLIGMDEANIRNMTRIAGGDSGKQRFLKLVEYFSYKMLSFSIRALNSTTFLFQTITE